MTSIRNTTACGAALLGALSLAGAAEARMMNYEANLADLSGLGGSAMAMVQFDTIANTLKVDIMGSGFAPNMIHRQHIHGRFNADGSARDSVSPTMAADDPANGGDGDGIIDLFEGAPSYGTILLRLFDEDNTDNGYDGFPEVTDMAGTLNFSYTYDLGTTTAFNGDKNLDGNADDPVVAADLFPLQKREIVIHGAFLGMGQGGVGGEAPDFPAGYSQLVPVAAGELNRVGAVPLPAAGWALMAALGGLGLLRRKAG